MPSKKKNTIPTSDKVNLVAQWLLEKKAKDLVALDVTKVCTITEAMIVATAGSVRQAQTLADHILTRAAEEKLSYLGMDGYKTGQWILVDLNDVIVHIFQEESRGFYNIEGLWAEGVEMPLPEAPAPTAE
ncbi:ribosome silencing factor [Fundidesulfovibrio agrisoli]|uniref:ribosome silencing factor n=1 Tax=Fundidesulfovibrio agrisoli TaxID=2922717 RepID=UPI001FADB4D0|nr:ribosome silencing factor [Fundidesulfovibrio agrisoli]